MKLKRKLFWICPLSLLCAFVLTFGGILALRGDMRYRFGLLLRTEDAVALNEVVPGEDWERRAVEALLTDPRVSRNDFLLLVNSDHSLGEEFTPLLTEGETNRMNPTVQAAFLDLQAAAFEATGETVLLRSAYRSPEEQVLEWEQSGDSLAARPGYSEHETGLALDICVEGFGGMSFLKTKAGRYVNDHAQEHGFVIRYPQGERDFTGFSYEPWHIRYVGAPHASIMTDAELVLEEYLAILTPDVWFQSGSYYILKSSADTVPVPSGFSSCSVTKDSEGYWIYTFEMP